jgi:hypothetical protein
MTTLKCDMSAECSETVDHIDNRGFVYCAAHGLRRRTSGTPCRKMRKAEIAALGRGDTISWRTR